MGMQELMYSQDPTGVHGHPEIHKHPGADGYPGADGQEPAGTQESMGTQELTDIWEPGTPTSPCCAPALALLKHPPPGSMLLAAACVQSQEKNSFEPTPASIPSITHAPRTPSPTAPQV